MLFVCSVALAMAQYQATVVRVIDGNTLEIRTKDAETYTVGWYGIDCPEEGQPYAAQARDYIRHTLINKTVLVTDMGKDRRGKRLVSFALDGVDMRIQLLDKGLAWTTDTSKEEDHVRRQERAKAAGIGLWTEVNPTPPWVFRRQQTMLQAKTS